MRKLAKTNTTNTQLKYKPNLFQSNHKIPVEIASTLEENELQSNKQPGMFSVVIGTVGLTSGLFLMGITGTLWTQNVSTLAEWKQRGGTKS
ncbi:hypothetical protein C6P44_003126 [Monosporozyma unispora]|nr:hypothetical protein C6P44_003126 [Kazachstania unispora]